MLPRGHTGSAPALVAVGVPPFPSPRDPAPAQPLARLGGSSSGRRPGRGNGTGRGAWAGSPAEPRAAGSGAGWHPVMADWAALLRSLGEPWLCPAGLCPAGLECVLAEGRLAEVST